MFPLQERSSHRFPTDCTFPHKNYLLDPIQTSTSCKADIRNPLSLFAHERSRFATCQWELLTPTDISIPLTHRLVLYALEAGECLFCVHFICKQTTESDLLLFVYSLHLILQRIHTFITGTNPDNIRDIIYKNLAITDMSGIQFLFDEFHDLIHF